MTTDLKPILITGGAGFFGSLLKKKLLDLGFDCVSIDLQPDEDEHAHLVSIQGDIRDESLMEEIFSKYKFDYIFHCAAI